MAEVVYILCALTSIACASLLVRGYRRSRTRFLMWCALCFLLLAASNLILVFDLLVTGPNINLLPMRLAVTVVAVAMLVYGAIEEAI